MERSHAIDPPPKIVRHGVVNVRLILAIAAVWLLWGSTYAGMHYAVQTIPPFAMVAIRFTFAGALLYAICAVRGQGRITRADMTRGFVTGAALLLLGNGVTAWTLQFLPTGVNSLILSLSPIWMALIAFVWGGERPGLPALAGMLLGFAGLGILLLGPGTSGSLALGPALLAIFASVAWAFGSIYARRSGKVDNLLLATSLQMLAGGLLLAIEAAIFGEWRAFNLAAISGMSWAGLAWLIAFGSLLGYSAYLYTMQVAGTALASTYAYINPIVAVVVGIALFHERFTPVEAIASAIILGGVALMLVPAPHRSPRSVRA